MAQNPEGSRRLYRISWEPTDKEPHGDGTDTFINELGAHNLEGGVTIETGDTDWDPDDPIILTGESDPELARQSQTSDTESSS